MPIPEIPQTAATTLGKKLIELSNWIQRRNALVRAGVGGVGGAAAGYYVMPHAFGYYDTPQSRQSAAVSNAIWGAIAGGMGPSRIHQLLAGPEIQAVKDPLKRIGMQTAPVSTLLAAETLPIAQSFFHKQREAATETAKAQRELARAAVESSIPKATERAIHSPLGKGMAGGAGVAGLAALLTGLERRRTESELQGQQTRAGMITTDFLKYLLPSVIAGGVIGSLAKKQEPGGAPSMGAAGTPVI